MKSAGRLENIKTRSQIKMICISEDDFSFDILLEISVINTLDRSYSAHRHENRSLDLTVICSDHATSCC